MSAWVWLVVAAVTAAGAMVVGRPAWTGFAARRNRDLNTERYLAWRGRAGERPPDPTLTRGERAQLFVAGVLALLAIFALVAYLTTL
jgi:hypothetical protein